MGGVLPFIFVILGLISSSYSEQLEDEKYWLDHGKAQIEENLRIAQISGKAKNGIVFVGDGMGLATVTASRIYKGQQEGKPGEEGYLFFEKFPNVGLLKTYNVDRQVPDSAATATALFTGVKTNFLTVGIDATGQFEQCPQNGTGTKLKSIIDWAIAEGKSTGVVTTTRITHATPASAYARSPSRDWECDTKIPKEQKELGCKDIARQLVEDLPGREIKVIMGGGEQILRARVNASSTLCRRGDSKDLVWSWMQYQRRLGRKYRYISNKRQLLDENVINQTDYLLAIFSPDHVALDRERNAETPTLTQMTHQAIKILSRNPKGYLLIVEGGRIDHAHHNNQAEIALEETVAFDKAIQTAKELTDEKDTLIVVTADHSHSMSMNGYPVRGNPIWDVAGVTNADGFAYQTLSYIVGPGYYTHRLDVDENSTLHTPDTWKDLVVNDTSDNRRKKKHHAGIFDWAGTHGGEDVPVYAVGPMAHLLVGVHEQTHVAHTVGYSLCIGPYVTDKSCTTTGKDSKDKEGQQGAGTDDKHGKHKGDKKGKGKSGASPVSMEGGMYSSLIMIVLASFMF